MGGGKKHKPSLLLARKVFDPWCRRKCGDRVRGRNENGPRSIKEMQNFRKDGSQPWDAKISRRLLLWAGRCVKLGGSYFSGGRAASQAAAVCRLGRKDDTPNPSKTSRKGRSRQAHAVLSNQQARQDEAKTGASYRRTGGSTCTRRAGT